MGPQEPRFGNLLSKPALDELKDAWNKVDRQAAVLTSVREELDKTIFFLTDISEKLKTLVSRIRDLGKV